MLTKIKTLFTAINRLCIKREIPVIVYAPGRVGSMSLITALHEADVFSFKVESFSSEPRGATKFCKLFVVDAHKSAKIISLVRDPMEILVSLFYSKLGRGRLSLSKEAAQAADLDTLERMFIEEILHSKYFTQHVEWFEHEYQQHLGIDAFAHPFDTKQRHDHIAHDTYPTLILRSDLPNEEKEKQITSFLNINSLTIPNINVKANRAGGERYQAFKEKLQVPAEDLARIYTSRYATHFFSPEEIDASIKRWS